MKRYFRISIACLLFLGLGLFLGTRFLNSSNRASTTAFSDSNSETKSPDLLGKLSERAGTWAEKIRIGEIESKKKADAEFVKLEEDRKRNPVFSLMGADGRLTNGVAEIAHLTPDEAQACDKVLRSAWAKASQDFASRAVLDNEASDPNRGITVYRVPASQDQGLQALAELKNSLEQEVGQEKADYLSKGILGGGFFLMSKKMETRIEFDSDAKVYKYQYLSPETGESLSYGSAAFGEFPNQFGKDFDLSKIQH